MYGTWSYVQPNVCKVSANWSVVQTRGVWCLHQYARVQPMLNGVDTMELTPCSLLQIAEVQPNVCKVSANWAQWSLLQIAEVQPNVCKVTKKSTIHQTKYTKNKCPSLFFCCISKSETKWDSHFFVLSTIWLLVMYLSFLPLIKRVKHNGTKNVWRVKILFITLQTKKQSTVRLS